MIFWIIVLVFVKKAPKCSDENVVQTVKNIYAGLPEQIKQTNPLAAAFMQNIPKEITIIQDIRPTSYDKEINLRQCKANALLDDNKTMEISIVYTVQLSQENNDEYYVELDTSFLEGLMQQSIMNGLLK